MNAAVVIVTDADINERIKERAQVLGAYLSIAEIEMQKKWMALPIEGYEGFGNTYGLASLAQVELDLMKSLGNLQRQFDDQYHVLPVQVNNSHTKLIHTDRDGVVYVVGEIFEFDEPIMTEDFQWFLPCVSIINHLV